MSESGTVSEWMKGVKAALKKAGFSEDNNIALGMASAMLVGIVAAAVSGWLAVSGLLRLIRTKSFDGFVAYRVVAGLAIIAIAASSWR